MLLTDKQLHGYAAVVVGPSTPLLAADAACTPTPAPTPTTFPHLTNLSLLGPLFFDRWRCAWDHPRKGFLSVSGSISGDSSPLPGLSRSLFPSFATGRAPPPSLFPVPPATLLSS
jgi:hypothetical protein